MEFLAAALAAARFAAAFAAALVAALLSIIRAMTPAAFPWAEIFAGEIKINPAVRIRIKRKCFVAAELPMSAARFVDLVFFIFISPVRFYLSVFLPFILECRKMKKGYSQHKKYFPEAKFYASGKYFPAT